MHHQYNLYTKPGCVHCVSAKQLLESKGIPYMEFNIGTDILVEEVIVKFPGFKTVPIITDGYGTVVGGFKQLKEAIDNDDPTRIIVE